MGGEVDSHPGSGHPQEAEMADLGDGGGHRPPPVAVRAAPGIGAGPAASGTDHRAAFHSGRRQRAGGGHPLPPAGHQPGHQSFPGLPDPVGRGGDGLPGTGGPGRRPVGRQPVDQLGLGEGSRGAGTGIAVRPGPQPGAGCRRPPVLPQAPRPAPGVDGTEPCRRSHPGHRRTGRAPGGTHPRPGLHGARGGLRVRRGNPRLGPR